MGSVDVTVDVWLKASTACPVTVPTAAKESRWLSDARMVITSTLCNGSNWPKQSSVYQPRERGHICPYGNWYYGTTTPPPPSGGVSFGVAATKHKAENDFVGFMNSRVFASVVPTRPNLFGSSFECLALVCRLT